MISTEHDESILIEDDNAQHLRIAEAQIPCNYNVEGTNFEHLLPDPVEGALDNREHVTEVIGNSDDLEENIYEQHITGIDGHVTINKENALQPLEHAAEGIHDSDNLKEKNSERDITGMSPTTAHHLEVNDIDARVIVRSGRAPNNPCSQKVNPELGAFRENSNPSLYKNQYHGDQPRGSKRRISDVEDSSNAKRKTVGKSSQPKENDLKKELIKHYLDEDLKRHIPNTKHLMSHIEHNTQCKNKNDCGRDCNNYKCLLRKTPRQSEYLEKLLVLIHAVNCRNDSPCYLPFCGHFSNILMENVDLRSNDQLLVRFAKGSFGSIYLNLKYGEVDKMIQQHQQDQKYDVILNTSRRLLERNGFDTNNPYLVVPKTINNRLLRMDYMDASLLEYWEHNRPFSTDVSTKISYFLARCVKALHVMNLVHCDIKLENFAIRMMAIQGQIEFKDWLRKAYFGTGMFVNGYIEFKLIDLDFVSRPKTICAGSKGGYASPAVSNRITNVDKCDDVYSLGITMKFLKENSESNIRFDDLTNRMTSIDPSRRPSVPDVVQELLKLMEINLNNQSYALLPPMQVVWPQKLDTPEESRQFFILMMKKVNIHRRKYLAETSSGTDLSQI